MNFCADIDECAMNSCGDNGVCSNTVGSFNCACNDGFSQNETKFCTGVLFIIQLTYVCISYITSVKDISNLKHPRARSAQGL